MLPIKVLIVDDSIVFRELLVQNLGRDPAIQVVGTARDPFEARDAILALKPDVMTLDIELPRMNGIEFLRKLMPQYPLPVVVISSLSDKVFDAMNAGAVDFVAKPVVRQFGTDIPGIVCVQHMPPGFTQMYAKRLDDECQIRVKEAETGDRVLPGHMLIAPGGDRHMRLVKVGGSYQVEIKPGPRVNGHCPSVEVLFDSVAKAAGPDAVGIILTGMGGDGAKGLLAMRKAGARTIGQDESTCVVYGMPKVAYDLGAVEYQEKLTDIAQRTYALLNKM